MPNRAHALGLTTTSRNIHVATLVCRKGVLSSRGGGTVTIGPKASTTTETVKKALGPSTPPTTPRQHARRMCTCEFVSVPQALHETIKHRITTTVSDLLCGRWARRCVFLCVLATRIFFECAGNRRKQLQGQRERRHMMLYFLMGFPTRRCHASWERSLSNQR